jgi:hypothetical protein
MNDLGGVVFKDNPNARAAPNSELPPDHPARAAPTPVDLERIRWVRSRPRRSGVKRDVAEI